MYRFLLTFISASLLLLISCNQAPENYQNGPTIDEMIGQLFMVGFKGFEAADTSHIRRDIEELNLGGVILFDYDVPTSTPERNIESPDQVRQLIAQLQDLAETPLLMAVDQEGGRVARLKTDRGFADHRSASFLGDTDSADTTRYYARIMAEQLRDLGFNVNFAPVVDLNTNPENPVIGQLDRSFAADPETVLRHSEIFLEEFTSAGVLAVLKHFPGHGSAWNDSHVGMADVTDTWDEIELEPYRQLAENASPFTVMTAHVLNENLDEVPATLSRDIQTVLLREEIGFEGVLFSDDMQMDAIRNYYGLERAIGSAINAGVDMLIFANNSVYDPDILPRGIEIVKELIESGEISEERIIESYERVMATKEQLFD